MKKGCQPRKITVTRPDEEIVICVQFSNLRINYFSDSAIKNPLQVLAGTIQRVFVINKAVLIEQQISLSWCTRSRPQILSRVVKIRDVLSYEAE